MKQEVILLPSTSKRRSKPAVVPLNGRSCMTDSKEYLRELGVDIDLHPQKIQFNSNHEVAIHGWWPYVQGFSHIFVQRVIDEYGMKRGNAIMYDPFAGAGTVLVQAKMNGVKSAGTELNPLLHFIAKTKVDSWGISGKDLLRYYERMPRTFLSKAPDFLESERHFRKTVLSRLERLKGGIEYLEANGRNDKLLNLIKVAFASILIDCSNLVRTPCLGYSLKKKVSDDAPYLLMDAKVRRMAKDLDFIRENLSKNIEKSAIVELANAKTYTPENDLDLIVTSPPYMNGIDYVINYKIEMAWLGFIKGHKEAKKIKNEMVVCDNVSKGLTRDFAANTERYTNSWIERIKNNIKENIETRGFYRRTDMPEIIHKYFDDLWQVYRKLIPSMKRGGRFILVVGDSFIANNYLPTDLILAKMGRELGLEIEKIELARWRKSGQVLSYKLRETIVTLKKK
jgi:DNA modification methylase